MSPFLPIPFSSSFFFFLINALVYPPAFASAMSLDFPNFEEPRLSCSADVEGICLRGQAFVDPSAGAVQLTRADVGRGLVLFSQPLLLWNSTTGELANFTTNFSFDVVSDSDSDVDPNRPVSWQIGHGVAFFLVPVDWELASDEGSWGHPPRRAGNINFITVEFSNDRQQDGRSPNCTSHVGINVNSHSMGNDVWSNTSLCMGGDVLTSGPIGVARVSYDYLSKNLSVSLTYNNSLYELSNAVDLTRVLPECVSVGFTASTDQYAYDVKRVLSWSLESTLETVADNEAIPQTTTTTNTTGDRNINSGHWRRQRPPIFAMILVATWILLLIAMLCLLWFVLRTYRVRRAERGGGNHSGERRQRAPDHEEAGSRQGATNIDEELGRGPRSFTFDALVAATKNFKEEWNLGKGGSACVYRGFLRDHNREVAVKRIAGNPWHGRKAFVAEIKAIGQLRHRNLVPLIGWCREDSELLLVYEFMAHRSLDTHLFHAEKVLPWPQRNHIALGVACALAYLHDGWDQCVLHRDIKSSNVMLDREFNARLGDFGLARLTDHRGSSLQTHTLAGTMGYMAPELFAAGKSSKETDVYSCGIVLLEIACGRRAVDHEVKGKEMLINWLWALYRDGTVMDAVDEKLSTDFDGHQMEQLIMVGLWCSHPDPSSRPSSTQVVSALKFEVEVPRLTIVQSDDAQVSTYVQSPATALPSTPSTESSIVQPMLMR